MIFVGIDWAEHHHDVCVLDREGRVLATTRIPDGIGGLTRLHAVLADHADDPASVVAGIETDRGLLVGALVAAGYQMVAVNPLAASRYRERHTTSGAKSDPGDARVLADLVRTDRHHHRPIAGDSPTVEVVKVLARAHQTLVWTRQRQANQLRSTLREFYPGALAAFGTDLAGPDALAVLAAAPTPAQGRALGVADLTKLLRAAGRQRNLPVRASAIRQALAAPQLAAPPVVAAAYGQVTAALVGVITELTQQIATLEDDLTRAFEAHPDAEILRSLPGLGVVLGARVLPGVRGRPDPLRPPYRPQGLRRHRPRHPRVRHPQGRAGPRGPQQAPGRRLLPVGVLGAVPLTRRPRLLRPAPRPRRHPPPGPTCPGQPAGRHPARLPAPPQPLRRAARLGPPHPAASSLTPTSRGMSRREPIRR